MSERGLELYQQSGISYVTDPAVQSSGYFADVLNISRRFFPMPRDRRSVVQNVIDSTWSEVHIEYIHQIISEAHEYSIESLKRIGLTPRTYLESIAGIVTNNTHRLREIIEESERVMGRIKSKKTETEAQFQPKYDPKLMAKHQEFIEKIMQEVAPTERPNIIILVGPPGCGKTEVFKQEKDCQRGKAVNIDIDEIRKLLKPNFNPKNQQEVEDFREEAWRFADNLLAQCIATKRSMVLQTSLARKEFWLHNDALHDAVDNHQFSIRVKVIMRDIHDSFRRAMLRGMPMDANSDVEGRMVALGDFLEATRGYWVIEPFVREYKAKLELHDYLQYSRGKTRMKSAMGAKVFSRLQWLSKWSWTIDAAVVDKKEDAPIEKSRKVGIRSAQSIRPKNVVV